MRCGNGLLLGLFTVPFSLAWSASSLVSRSHQPPPPQHTAAVARSRRHSAVALQMSSSSITTSGGGGMEHSPEPSSRSRKISVAALLASAFLNLLGFTMAGPITPALGQHFGLSVGASFGSLTSAYPLGMLLGLFLWPQLSDRIGRKPVIAASLLGSGLGLAAQAHVISAEMSLAVFLMTRVLTGSFAGSSPVGKAYLADVGAEQGKLPRYLALRDAASTMAFIVGPLLGGVVFDARKHVLGIGEKVLDAEYRQTTSSLAFVISISAAASLAAAALVALFVTEVAPKHGKQTTTTKNSEADDNSSNFLESCPLGRSIWTGVATVCVVSFLFNVGDSTFHAFFSALLRDNLGLDAHTIGLSYTIFACMSFSVSTTSSSRLVKKLGPVATCVAGLSAIGMGLMGLSFSSTFTAPHPAWVLGAAALYYCGVPLYGPTIPTMLLRCVPPNKRGAVMGLDGAINTVGRVIAPLLMGELYRRFGPAVAFGLAGMVVFGAAGTALLRRIAVMRKLKVA